MSRHEATRQFVAGKHHAGTIGCRSRGENLCVPGIVNAGCVERRFVDRSGADGIHLTRQRRRDRGLDVAIRRQAAGLIHGSWLHSVGVDGSQIEDGRLVDGNPRRRPFVGTDRPVGQLCRITAKCRRCVGDGFQGESDGLSHTLQDSDVTKDHRYAPVDNGWLCQHSQADFGADSGGIAHRDGDAW